VCIDDANVARSVPLLGKRFTTYGIERTDADYVAASVRYDGLLTHFRVIVRGRDHGEFTLQMPGIHNVANALAAIAIADELEVPIDVTRAALAGFEGVQRRFTILGEAKGVMVVDDYGHHPTEVRATLAGARASFPSRRIVAALQPHRYSRLRDNMDRFAASLDAADVVVLTDVYPAGEAPITGVDAARLVELVQARRPDRLVVHEADVATLAGRLATLTEPGDLVLTLGAGSITRTGPQLLVQLETPLPATGTER